MRLIDADELDRMGYILTRTYQQDVKTMVYETNKLSNVPTAQPEIIKCKDCKWWKTNYMWNGKECKVCVKEPYEPVRASDFFCADGERREDDALDS